MGRPKKQLQNMQQIDAKDYNAEKAKPRSLDEIWGYKLSKYKTDNEEEYQDSISGLNKIDLQKECIKVGLAPNDNRNIMTERLMKAFRIHVAGVKTSGLQSPSTKVDMSKKLKNILAKGANGIV